MKISEAYTGKLICENDFFQNLKTCEKCKWNVHHVYRSSPGLEKTDSFMHPFLQMTRNMNVNVVVGIYDTPMQYTAIFHGLRNDDFHLNFFDIFIFLLKTYIVGTR